MNRAPPSGDVPGDQPSAMRDRDATSDRAGRAQPRRHEPRRRRAPCAASERREQRLGVRTEAWASSSTTTTRVAAARLDAHAMLTAARRRPRLRSRRGCGSRSRASPDCRRPARLPRRRARRATHPLCSAVDASCATTASTHSTMCTALATPARRSGTCERQQALDERRHPAQLVQPRRPVASHSSTGRGWRSATSSSVAITASGVRSSCDASAANRASAPKPSSRRANSSLSATTRSRSSSSRSGTGEAAPQIVRRGLARGADRVLERTRDRAAQDHRGHHGGDQRERSGDQPSPRGSARRPRRVNESPAAISASASSSNTIANDAGGEQHERDELLAIDATRNRRRIEPRAITPTSRAR